MTDKQPLSLLCHAVMAWAYEQNGERPLNVDPGVWHGETDEWKVAVNAQKTEIDGVAPYHVHCEHKTLVRFAVMNPLGGQITPPGIEDEMIEHFQSRTAAPDIEAAQ